MELIFPQDGRRGSGRPRPRLRNVLDAFLCDWHLIDWFLDCCQKRGENPREISENPREISLPRPALGHGFRLIYKKKLYLCRCKISTTAFVILIHKSNYSKIVWRIWLSNNKNASLYLEFISFSFCVH